MNSQLRAWGPAALWAVVLFLLSSTPGTAMPSVSVNDLLVHAVAYAVLGAALAFGRVTSGANVTAWVLMLVGSAYGATDELHQMLVPGRYPAVSDWVADTVGVVLGYALWAALVNRIIESKTTR